MQGSTTPGPGSYNLDKGLLKSPWNPIPVICYIPKVGENCVKCHKLLLGDFYLVGYRYFWCFDCHSKNTLILRKKKTIKLRHCSCLHEHIGVRGITVHKNFTKTNLVKNLEKKEKFMWARYGTVTYISF